MNPHGSKFSDGESIEHHGTGYQEAANEMEK